MLKPGSTIKSIPTLSQLHVTHRFDNPASGAIIQALMKTSKRTGQNRGPLIQGDIYYGTFLVNGYWLQPLTPSFYLCSQVVCLIKAHRWLGSSHMSAVLESADVADLGWGFELAENSRRLLTWLRLHPLPQRHLFWASSFCSTLHPQPQLLS